MYDYENPVLRWIATAILVLCILFAAFSVFTGIMGAQNAKKQIKQYENDYQKISKEIEDLEAKQEGLVGETITAQDLGSAIAKDQNVLSKYAKKMYDETISGEESRAVQDLMSDLALKLGNSDISAGNNQKESYFKYVWTKNPKAEVRFETVLKYYTESIDCLFTIWDGDHFYGYVTGSYDEQAGTITDPVIVFTAYGEKNEPKYVIEESNNNNNTDEIKVPDGASYTADEIKAILAKNPEDRSEEEWALLQKYWSDNNMEDQSPSNTDGEE